MKRSRKKNIFIKQQFNNKPGLTIRWCGRGRVYSAVCSLNKCLCSWMEVYMNIAWDYCMAFTWTVVKSLLYGWIFMCLKLKTICTRIEYNMCVCLCVLWWNWRYGSAELNRWTTQWLLDSLPIELLRLPLFNMLFNYKHNCSGRINFRQLNQLMKLWFGTKLPIMTRTNQKF